MYIILINNYLKLLLNYLQQDTLTLTHEVAVQPLISSVTVTQYLVLRLGVARGFGQSPQDKEFEGDHTNLYLVPPKGFTLRSTNEPFIIDVSLEIETVMPEIVIVLLASKLPQKLVLLETRIVLTPGLS